MHELLWQYKNSRNREVLQRMDSSSSLTILDPGNVVDRPSSRKQCEMLSTSRSSMTSKIYSRASFISIEHLTLKTFSFGILAAIANAKFMSKEPMTFSWVKFLQFLLISSMIYGGWAIQGIVRDSSSCHLWIAWQIPFFVMRFQAGKTSLLRWGHLLKLNDFAC